ncbi:MAG TPA: hypothetical protein VHE35_22425, partial [Kofleriaceae bacterium]|nr:hypothetical protein [Kofleriaceae bacterium]
APAPAPAAAPAPTAADLAAATSIGREQATGTVRAVHVVSRVGGSEAPADATPKRARLADGVTLYALVEVADGATTRWYSDAGSVRWRGKLLAPAPLADAPAMSLWWHRIEPTVASMSNTSSGVFRFERVPYRATTLPARGGALAADVRPTLTPDHGDGVGTMRYQVLVRQGDRVVASPGAESVRGRGSGGLTDDVQRVSLRHDDSFLGMLEEMYGQPYIWASAGSTDRTHQSERLEGADCADLMVYGARRLGLAVPYGYTGSLGQHARTLARGSLATDGVYRDAAGQAIPFTAAGDMILFPGHVGALAEDHGVPGVLDQDDVMVHTLFDSPKRQRIADSGYADNDIQILRWNGLPRRAR